MKLVALTVLGVFAQAALAADLESEIIAKEKATWDAEVQKDAAAFGKLVTADFVIVNATGFAEGRDAASKDAVSCDIRTYGISNAKLQRLTADVVVLHYVATADGACGGKPMPPKVLATSVWQKVKGEWLNAAFHQSPAE